jgi:hypothetical protein
MDMEGGIVTEIDQDSPLYPVLGDDAVLTDLALPRRPAWGSRGVLLVDRPTGTVWVLDADDEARAFRLREKRDLAGDPADLSPPDDGSDNVVRAALETEYDVTAAPWAGGGA